MTHLIISLVLLLANVEIYHFTDRTVYVVPACAKVKLIVESPVVLVSTQTADQTRFKTLAGSEVFHTVECRIVADRPDAMTLTPEQCLLKRPCYFCKPEVLP